MADKKQSLPPGWSTTRHRCDLPFQVYFHAQLGIIFDCEHCHREWEVYSVTTDRGSGVWHLGFKLLSDNNDTRPIMRRIN